MDKDQFRRFVTNICKSQNQNKISNSLSQLQQVLERDPMNEDYVNKLKELLDCVPELYSTGIKLGNQRLINDEDFADIAARAEERKQREREALMHGRC